MKKYLLLIFLFILGFNLYSQENDEKEKPEDEEEVLELELDEDDIFDEEDLFSLDGKFDFKMQPFIKLSMGMASPIYKGATGGDLDHIKAIFGFNTIKTEEVKNKNKEIIGTLREFSNYGLLIENYDYGNGILITNDGKDNFSFWKFGFARTDAEGYILGDNADITLGQESGFGWQKLSYQNEFSEEDLLDDLLGENNPYTKLQLRYIDEVRFSEYYGALIKIRPIKQISLDMEFQQDLIYPRFMTWHWIASGITGGIVEGLAGYFVKKIKKSSPYAAPIVGFLLKNGISYAFMELRKDNMNWPINSEQPLIINSFNLGINYHF